MKKQPSTRKLRLIDETGKVLKTIILTPNKPDGALYINQKEWMKDQTDAGLIEAAIKAHDDAICIHWTQLRAINKYRAKKLLETLYGYFDDENEDS